MAHIAVSDENTQGSSTAEQRVHIMQRLAELGEMTGGIAHDIRNILAVIEGGLKPAESNMEQPGRVPVYIAAAREAIDRGIGLTFLAFGFREATGARRACGRCKTQHELKVKRARNACGRQPLLQWRTPNSG